MAEFLIYTIPTCPYCLQAKDLLNRKNLSFEEILFEERTRDESIRKLEELFKKTKGMKTFPQIFDIREAGSEKHIGGYDDLKKKFDNNEI